MGELPICNQEGPRSGHMHTGPFMTRDSSSAGIFCTALKLTVTLDTRHSNCATCNMSSKAQTGAFRQWQAHPSQAAQQLLEALPQSSQPTRPAPLGGRRLGAKHLLQQAPPLTHNSQARKQLWGPQGKQCIASRRERVDQQGPACSILDRGYRGHARWPARTILPRACACTHGHRDCSGGCFAIVIIRGKHDSYRCSWPQCARGNQRRAA